MHISHEKKETKERSTLSYRLNFQYLCAFLCFIFIRKHTRKKYIERVCVCVCVFFSVSSYITMDALMNRGGFRVSVCGQEEIEQLSRDGSHYSLSTGILPSLGARSSRRIKLRRFILSPYDHRYRCTDFYFLGFCLWALFCFVLFVSMFFLFPRFFLILLLVFIC